MGGGNVAQCLRLDHHTEESDVRVAQHAFASVVQATWRNAILMQVVVGMTSPSTCRLKAFSADLVQVVLRVSVRNSSESRGLFGLRAKRVSQEEMVTSVAADAVTCFLSMTSCRQERKRQVQNANTGKMASTNELHHQQTLPK